MSGLLHWANLAFCKRTQHIPSKWKWNAIRDAINRHRVSHSHFSICSYIQNSGKNRSSSVLEVHCYRKYSVKYLRNIWKKLRMPTTVHFTWLSRLKYLVVFYIVTIFLLFLDNCFYRIPFYTVFLSSSTVHFIPNSIISLSSHFNGFHYHSIPLFVLKPSIILFAQTWQYMAIGRLVPAERRQSHTNEPCNISHFIKHYQLRWLWKYFLPSWRREMNASPIPFLGRTFYSHVLPYIYKLSSIQLKIITLTSA